MKSKYFFHVSWLVQLVVGISLFTVSFLIENQILQAFIATPILALLLAASLELGKAVAIIWHRYMTYRSAAAYPKSVRWASAIFRVGLVILSMLCSLLFLSDNLDRPNLEAVRTAETDRSEGRLKESLLRLETQSTERLSLFKQNQTTENERLKQGFEARILLLEAELNTEMNNVVNGTFKGPRYIELQARLQAEKLRQAASLEGLRRDGKKVYLAERDRLFDRLERKREQAYEKADNKRSQLISHDFANDERANDSRIVSFLKVTESVFSTEIFPLQFVFLFSLLISLLMEVGILLAFNTVTLSILPAFKASHDADLSKDILNTEINKEAKEDEMRHEEALNRIRNTANNVMDKAQEYMSTQKPSNQL